MEKVALAGWALLSGTGSNGFVAINGGPAFETFNYFLPVPRLGRHDEDLFHLDAGIFARAKHIPGLPS